VELLVTNIMAQITKRALHSRLEPAGASRSNGCRENVTASAGEMQHFI